MSHLLHIVPHLPPRVSGVGDAALVLGERVEEVSEGSVVSSYIAAGWDAGIPSSVVGALDLTGRRDAHVLAEAISERAPGAVLLHYVGYGYARRGTPLWLLDALQQLRRTHPDVRRVTMFHELYAMGPPWQSSFWTSPMQRRIAAEVAQLSDGLLTNRTASADWLRLHAPGTPVKVCPVSSGVGEPETVRQWAEREPVAIIFGGPGQRGAVYSKTGKPVRRILDRAGIKRVWDIGPPAGAPDTYAGRPVELLGRLDATDVGERLQAARIGLLDYPPAFVTKSSIAGAYLAHGVPMLTVNSDRRPAGSGPPPMMTVGTAGEMNMPLLVTRSHRWYSALAHSALAAQSVLHLLDIQRDANGVSRCARPSVPPPCPAGHLSPRGEKTIL